MKVLINQNRKLNKINEYNTQNENKVTELTLELPEEYENWNKRIVFITDEGTFWDYIQDNTYLIKKNVTQYERVQFYIWLTNGEQDFRSETEDLTFKKNKEAEDLIPTEEQIDGFNTLITTLNLEITRVDDKETELNGIIADLQYKLDTDYFKGEKGDTGEDGNDGFSPSVTVQETDTGATISITDKNGITTANILNGQDGTNGKDGLDGEDGKSAYEIWLDEGNEGTEQDFLDSLKGVDGIDGRNGTDGINGTNGQDGYTPVKGTDYWTNADKAEIVQSAVTQVETDIQPTITSIENTADTANSTANTAKSIAEGANQALSYGNYSTMITAFNALANNVYNVGQNVMIITLNVPDLWISGIESTSQSYTYTTDEAFTTELSTNGYVQVGYYKLSALETQKVDLTEYVTNTDYATSVKGGVFKINNGIGISANGYIYVSAYTYQNYQNASANLFVAKGTLENVITGKNLETGNNKVTTISSSSTNTEYPSAKAVYDYIQSLDGDEVSY